MASSQLIASNAPVSVLFKGLVSRSSEYAMEAYP